MSAEYPRPKDAGVSARMRANTRRDTAPELAIRSQLHRLGLRYRVDDPIVLPGRRPVRPDVVFRSAKVAFFCDGCYWHCCPQHGTQPAYNSEYWSNKLLRNVARDREVDLALQAEGWLSVRRWEHERPAEIAAELALLVRARMVR
jgi:DNA mismatch endonuclease (patch repair protein)